MAALAQPDPSPTIFRNLGRNRSAPLEPVLKRLPPLTGDPIRIKRAEELQHGNEDLHASSFLRTRLILFNCSRAEFPRIFVHELFHFAWPRLGNGPRHEFEGLLRGELRAGAPGELGWSAEWRKLALAARDPRSRNRRWREYCCESFCDTAAWRYSGIRQHPEFTLPRRYRTGRRDWFEATFSNRRLPV